LNRGPDWRAYTPQERSKRQRATPSLSKITKIGMNTSFQTHSDYSGKKLDFNTRTKMYRLKKQDTRSKYFGKARNLSIAMSKINRLVEELHLPSSITKRAVSIYRTVLERDLVKGRTIAGFVAASIYAACREAKIPRSLNEISSVSYEDHKDISRVYRLILRELDLQMPLDHPMKFVPRIAEKLEVGRDTDQLSIELLRKAKKEKMLAGKDPRGMAAAALYLACKLNDEKRNQKDIAYHAGITEVTLRNRLKDLEKIPHLNEISHNSRYNTPIDWRAY
jgi:transcription initiation factor TFIIB